MAKLYNFPCIAGAAHQAFYAIRYGGDPTQRASRLRRRLAMAHTLSWRRFWQNEDEDYLNNHPMNH